jgi:CheY-like chemotaxis protein
MVAVSGLVRREDRVRSQDAGFDAHLSKPVDPMSLQDLLARVPPNEFARAPL